MYKYDKMDYHNLQVELRKEQRKREAVEMNNAELERCIEEWDSILMELDKNRGQPNDSEWETRHDNQVALNEQLRQEINFLEGDITEVIVRLTQKDYRKIQILTQHTCIDAMNFNLEALNEKELHRLMKQLERMRAHLYATLRESEWTLEKVTNEFRHLNQVRRLYRTELDKINMAIIYMGPPPAPPPTPITMMKMLTGAPLSKGHKKKRRSRKRKNLSRHKESNEKKETQSSEVVVYAKKDNEATQSNQKNIEQDQTNLPEPEDPPPTNENEITVSKEDATPPVPGS